MSSTSNQTKGNKAADADAKEHNAEGWDDKPIEFDFTVCFWVYRLFLLEFFDAV